MEEKFDVNWRRVFIVFYVEVLGGESLLNMLLFYFNFYSVKR